MAALHATVVRVILDAGHGLSNHKLGVYDEGASSPHGTEAYIVSRVAEQVFDRYYFARDGQCSAAKSLSVILTPECSIACAATHKTESHLAYKIAWINDNCIHTQAAGYGDYVVSLHMDDSPESGVLAVICGDAPQERYHEAEVGGRLIAEKLGLPFRGVMLDTETPRKSIGIVRATKPPAILFELGSVRLFGDVQAVEKCGAEAVSAFIDKLGAPH